MTEDGKDDIDRLLGADEPPPFESHHAEGKAPVLLVCDHAACRVPRRLNMLGLDPATLGQHIGWDIGAADVTRRLARLLDAPAILTNYSRLVIDCNREPGQASAIAPVSDGVVVPGNQNLGADARALRVEALFRPYQNAVGATLDGFAGRRIAPAVISMHSFTPRMCGFDRPWHVGLLWDKDPRMSLPLIAGLGSDAKLVVGDNEPYTARDPEGFTLEHHAIPRGLPHVLIELRQNEIDTAEGAERYARMLHRALGPVLADPDLYRPARYL